MAAAAAPGSAQRPLLDDFDGDFEPPPPASQQVGWWSWGGRAVSVIGAVGFGAMRAVNLNSWTNVIGSAGAGFCIQSLIQTGHVGESAARVRQWSSTAFGAISFFGVSQVVGNVTSYLWRNRFTHVAIGLFGANLAIAAQWVVHRSGIRVESVPAQGAKGERIKDAQFLRRIPTHVLKVIATAGLTALRFLSPDPIVQGMASFGASFLGSQVAGEWAMDALDRLIERTGRGRVMKLFILTAQHLALPAAFIPWSVPGSEARMRLLAISGAGLGLSNGMGSRAEMRRIEKIRIADLEEFHELQPPKERLHSWAYKAFKFTAPAFATLGMIGFTLWQEAAPGELQGNDAKIALGSMLGGFLSTYCIGKWVDTTWSPERRISIKDKLMVSLWVNQRFLGIPPLMVYYAVTNVLPMEGNSIDHQKSPYHVAAICLGYFFYGASAAQERVITESERIGNPQLKAAKWMFANGALTSAVTIMRKYPWLY